MVGCIRFRDVAAHPLLVVRGFGLRAFAACVWAAATRRSCTFLDLVRCTPAGTRGVDGGGSAC